MSEQFNGPACFHIAELIQEEEVMTLRRGDPGRQHGRALHVWLHAGRRNHAPDQAPDLSADAGGQALAEPLLVSIDLSEIAFV